MVVYVKGCYLITYYKTNPDINGNNKGLLVDTESETIRSGYNLRPVIYDVLIKTNAKSIAVLKEILIKEGYIETE